MYEDEAVARASEIAANVLRGRAAEIDESGCWPEEGLRALQAAGLGGLVVSKAVGGHGLGLLAVVRVCEALGRECPSTAISFGMHLVGSAVLDAKPTPEQRQRFLEPIARGEHLTTLALSEPGTGAHFYFPQAQLEANGDGYLLSGTKSFVTNGGHADSYVFSAAAEQSATGPGEFSCVMVGADAPGLTWGGDWTGWGMRGNSARSATLDRVPVGAGDLLGHEGDQIWYVFRVVSPYFLMAMAGTYIGLAAAAVEEARQHLLQRRHSHTGDTLAQNQILQHRLGTLWAQVQRTRSFIYDAARLGDADGDDALLHLCSAKAEVAETAERVSAEAMTLMGGRGYASGQRIQRLYRDARAAHVMAPTTDLLRLWTGRGLLGLPLLGDE